MSYNCDCDSFDATSFFTSMVDRAGASRAPACHTNGLRGHLTALYLLLINLVGMGPGPTLVALVHRLCIR